MSLLTSVLKDVFGTAKGRAREAPPTSTPASARTAAAEVISPAAPFQIRRDVIFLAGYGQNDAINGLLREYEVLFRARGLAVHYFNLSDPGFDGDRILELLKTGNVAFALTYLGIGCEMTISTNGDQAVRQNIWDFFGIPVLKLNGDIPAYFAARHAPVPHTSVNVYYAREFHHYAEKWISGIDGGMLNVYRPPFAISCISPSEVNRSAKRSGKLVFLKNGNSPARLVDDWQRALTPMISRLLLELCEELRTPCLGSSIVFLDDLVLESLKRRGYSENAPPRLMHFLVAQLDDYFRRVKATMIAEALLDFPVIIQGNNWEHIDFASRKAVHLPGATFVESLDIYRMQLGVIDMSPNINSAPHDRVTRSAGTYSLCITNQQQWLMEHFPGFENLAFAFTPESIRERIGDALKRPDDYLDLAVAFGTRFREVWSSDRVFATLIEAVELASLLRSGSKPQLQPYFVW